MASQKGTLLTGSPPYDPRAVANLLLDVAKLQEIEVSNLALQKLLYFAHGHFLIQTGQPLVQGAFEAWNNGPVHPAVYHAFKLAGRETIQIRATGRNVMSGKTHTLDLPRTPEVLDHLHKVLAAYGHRSPGLLVAISHAPKGPWATVRDRAMREISLGTRIPDSLTKKLFHLQKISAVIGVESNMLADDAPLMFKGTAVRA